MLAVVQAINDANYAAAVSIAQRLANDGIPDAQHFMGWFHEQGVGVAKNEHEAFEWWRRAAVQGFAASQHALGACYERGTGTTPDLAEAFAWYSRAVNGGDEEAEKALQVLDEHLSTDDRKRGLELLQK